MNNEPKKQHIVPKVYLQNFVKKNGKLFKLKIDLSIRPRPKELHPSAICYKDYFYRFENYGVAGFEGISDANILERRGFLYENKLDKILKKLIDNKSIITLQEAFEFSFALFDIKMRNERIRNTLLSKESLNITFENLLNEHKKSPESIQPLLQRNGMDFDNFLEVFEKIRSTWLSDISLQKDLHNKYLLENKSNPSSIVKLIISKLALGEWYVLNTIINNQFITSDNPGYCFDGNNCLYNTKFGGAFDFYFPLTPYYLLIIKSPEIIPEQVLPTKRIVYGLAEKEVVKAANQNTMLIANKEIYAAYDSFLIQTWYALKNPSIITRL
ncbi:DUF4238 domain-containing protein [Larkinella arboricola]